MATAIDPHSDTRCWECTTEQRHRFQLDRPAARLGEMEDLHFHVDSAVLLPAREGSERGLEGKAGAITGLAVLRAAYLHAKEQPSDRLLVVGHTDPSGKKAYNRELSRLRAEGVLHALRGNRDAWAKIADRRHRVEDVQWILDWAGRAWGWPCAPGPVDGVERPAPRRAIERFQARYNAAFERTIAVDGLVGPETWGAVFDLYERELAALLDTDASGLEEHRARLRFLDGKPEAVGCGEHHARTAGRAPGSRARADRRVELLFFGKDRPRLRCHPDARRCEPEQCDVYDVFAWRWERVEVEPVPTLVWLDLQTVDALGYRVAEVALRLEPKHGEAEEIATDASGYWSGRVRAAGRIGVTLADGTPVRLGPSRTGDEEAVGEEGSAVLTPRLAARTVTDVVVPGASDEALAERRRLRARYGPRQTVGGSARGGEGAEPVGEKVGPASSRGGEDKEVTRRTVADVCADDLFVAGGLTEELGLDLDRLVEHLHTWLEDRHPSAIARGYFLVFVMGSAVKVVDVEEGRPQPVGDFQLAEGQAVGARFGAHAAVEHLGGGQGDARLVDMASATTGVLFGESKEKYLWQILHPDHQERFLDAVRERGAEGRIEIDYLLPPSPGDWIYLARRGGSGLLEDYPEDRALRSRVQTRNEAVAGGSGEAFGYYIRAYIHRVEAIDPDPAAAQAQGLPHPEMQLYALGPPESAYAYPQPAGATLDEYRRIASASSEHGAFEAWEAISSKLDAIWGVRSDGTLWIDFEFGVEAGGLARGTQVKWNFSIDDEGRVEGPKQGQAIAVTGENEKRTTKGTLTHWEDKSTDETQWKAGLSLGKWGFEADTLGTMKGSYGPAYSQANAITKEVGAGLEFDLRGLIAKRYEKTGKDVPDWVYEIPNLKTRVGINVRLSSQGTVLKAIAGPGFWGTRPRSEFVTLDWDSLDFDEQSHLQELGWDKRKWDGKELPETAGQTFASLDAADQMAAIMLPVPSTDYEWQSFWNNDFMKARPGVPPGGSAEAGGGSQEPSGQ